MTEISPSALTQQHLGALVSGLGGVLDTAPWSGRNRLVRIVHEREQFRLPGTFLGLASPESNMQAHGVFVPRAPERKVVLTGVTRPTDLPQSAGGLTHDAVGTFLRPKGSGDAPRGGSWQLLRVEHELSYDGTPENTLLVYGFTTEARLILRPDWRLRVPGHTPMIDAGGQP